MLKGFMRVMSFFIKEINEVRRQPALFLSLIGGPFLVLALFGATFQSSQPHIRTVLVWPEAGIQGIDEAKIQKLIGNYFDLVAVIHDRQEALDYLDSGKVDLVQMLAEDVEAQIASGKQPELEIITNTIDPTREAWIQSMVFAEVNLVNREILMIRTTQAQEKALDVEVKIADAHNEISNYQKEVTLEQLKSLQKRLPELQENLSILLKFLPVAESLGGSVGAQVSDARDSIYDLMDGIDDLDQSINSGELETQIRAMQDFDTQLLAVKATIEGFVQIPPDNIIAPVRSNYKNLHGKAYALMVFYAPGVLALLLQHLSVTLGALALVRERQSGAFEIFRVAPLNIVQVLIGKYLAYAVYVGLAAAALTGLLSLLHIPMLGSWGWFAALVLLMTFASLGYGFLISALSGSDSQAIQLSMLVLLLSIFFSGFFLTLDGFHWAAHWVAATLPLTHGLSGLQRIMLNGQPPEPVTWIALGLIAAVLFVLVWLVMRKAYKEAN